MPRFIAPIAILSVLVAGCGSVGAASTSTPVSAVSTTQAERPSIDLKITGGPGAGAYTTDASTSLDTCTKAPDGSWRLLYAGGDPWVSVDLLVGAGAEGPDGASSVAAEISAGGGYLWFDPAIMRGGDPRGRSMASVHVAPAGDRTTFVVSATTPDRTTGSDGEPVRVELTVTCPN